MSSPALEAFLAKLYTAAEARARFFVDMLREARSAGLTEAEATALLDIDRAGLEMAAASYARKREQHRRRPCKPAQTILEWMRRKTVR